MIEKTILHRLFCQHYSEMTHLAGTMLTDDDEAEDIVQNVFMRLMESDLAPAEGKMRAYLMTAVRNGCISRIRQKSMAERAKNLYAIETASDWQHIDRRLKALDAVRDYADSHLKEPHRTIFHLRFEEDLSLKEIAQRLDMNLKTVYKYLAQSIQSVQKRFRQ